MMHRGKLFGAMPADVLRRRIRRDRFRVRRFQLAQTARHRVVFKVGNGGRVLIVILDAAALHLGTKLFDLL